MSLRLRLTLLSVLLLAIALAGFALGIYLIASSRIYQGLDDGVTSRAQVVTNVLEPLTGPVSSQDIARSRQGLDREAAAGTIFEVRSGSGALLYSSLSPAGTTILPRVPTPSGPRFMTRTVQGRRLRVLVEPIISGNQVLGTVEVAQALSETDEALNEIRYVSIIGGISVLVAISVSAYVVAGRALDPVRRVSRLAQDIQETADFSRRLPMAGARGEMKELASTFNAMIARVERTLDAQRAFLADSSHELRRPLTVLRTNIDVIKNPDLSPQERTASLAEMSAEAMSMSRLISDLLLLSRETPQAIQATLVDYSALCQQTMTRLRTQDDGHELVSDVPPGVRVLGDRERLEQMLWNLLENAARYTPNGGRIALRLQSEDSVARIEIADDGVGIPEEDQPHLFERFFRGELARAMQGEGSGLGLAIVQYVVEAHGGSVRITSKPGEGTVVVVDLPLAS